MSHSPAARRQTARPAPAIVLLRYTRGLGIRPDDLDELVHRLAHEVGGCSEPKAFPDRALRGDAVRAAARRAAGINHGGLRSQVAFLLCHEGPQRCRQLLRQVAAGCVRRGTRPRSRRGAGTNSD